MLQKQVYRDFAPGVPGQKATPDQSIYTPVNYVAGETGALVGTFCWLSVPESSVQSMPQINEPPLGFVERVISFPLENASEEGSPLIPMGYAATVAVRGDYWVECGSNAAPGDQVYVSTNGNGVITNTAGAGYMAVPGWRFKTAPNDGGLAIISNWGIEPVKE